MCPFVVRKPRTTRGFVGTHRRVRLSGEVHRLPRRGTATRRGAAGPRRFLFRGPKRAALTSLRARACSPHQKPSGDGEPSNERDDLNGNRPAPTLRERGKVRPLDRGDAWPVAAQAMRQCLRPARLRIHRAAIRPVVTTRRANVFQKRTGPGDLPRPVAASRSTAQESGKPAGSGQQRLGAFGHLALLEIGDIRRCTCLRAVDGLGGHARPDILSRAQNEFASFG